LSYPGIAVEHISARTSPITARWVREQAYRTVTQPCSCLLWRMLASGTAR